MDRQHPFRGFGFLGVDEAGDQQVTIVQQFQSAPTPEPMEPVENRIYVPPRWVDGGYKSQDTGPVQSSGRALIPPVLSLRERLQSTIKSSEKSLRISPQG